MTARLGILLAGSLVAALMVATAGVAWAQTTCPPEDPDCNPGEEPPPPPGTPTVVRTAPADDATGFGRDASIKARFSEKMRAATINRSTFRIYIGNLTDDVLNPPGCPPEDPNCSTPPPPPPAPFGTKVSYNAKKKTATLNPSVRLAAGATYTAVVEGAGDGDGFAVRDRAGNAMARDKIFRFTTAGGNCGVLCQPS